MIRWHDFWRVYRQNHGAVLGLAALVIIVVAAIFGPMLYPVDPFEMVDRPILEPFGAHPLGTDTLGRDLAAGLLHGARVSLHGRPRRDRLRDARRRHRRRARRVLRRPGGRFLMRATEFFLTIPSFMLAILLVAVFSPRSRPSSAPSPPFPGPRSRA